MLLNRNLSAHATSSQTYWATLFSWLALSWPLYLLGFFLGESKYPVSLSLLIYLIISSVSIIKIIQGWKSPFFRQILALLIFQLIVFVYWQKSGESVISGVLLTALLIPLLTKPAFSKKEKIKILNYARIGFYLSFVFLLIEIYFSFRGVKIQMEIEGVFFRTVNLPVWERLRYFSLFDEPAHYAIYLCMLYVLLDLANFFQIKKFALLDKILIVGTTLITLSMSGLLLILLYLVLARGLHVRGSEAIIGFSKRVITGLAFGFIALMLANVFVDNFSTYFSNRLERTVETFSNKEFESEGLRTNSIRLLGELEGFGQVIGYESVAESGVYEITGDDDFRIANSFVNVVIRLGYLGLIMYLWFMISMCNIISRGLVVMFLVFNFVLGFWVSVLYWIPWLLIIVLFLDSGMYVKAVYSRASTGSYLYSRKSVSPAMIKSDEKG